MAYDYKVSGPVLRTPGDGHTYLEWIVRETDVSPGDQWQITDFPEVATLTLVGTERTTAGSVSTVQTELSKEAALSSNSLNYIAQAEAAGSVVRIAQNKRCPPGSVLHGCSHVNVAGGATSVITTRVQARLGHV